MYSNNTNINSIALAKTTSRKRGYIIGLGLLLALLMLVASFFVARPLTANAEVTTTPTSVVVGEIWNAEEERFYSDNLAILQRYIYGSDRVTPSKIDAMAEEGVDRLALNSKTVPAGFYKDTAYPAKSSTQDIIVTFCGFEWYLQELHIYDYNEKFGIDDQKTILELVPVDSSTTYTIINMEEFTDTTHILAYYIDYNMGYEAINGVVPLNLTHANNRTFDLSQAVVSQLPTDTSEEIITINGDRLVPGLDYKVDSIVSNGDNSGVVVDGEGMYSDNVGEEVSIVRPSAVGPAVSLNSGFYQSGVASISNGTSYNTLSHTGTCKVYYGSGKSAYAISNTVSRTAAGTSSTSLTAGAGDGALMIGAGTMSITIVKKSVSSYGYVSSPWYSTSGSSVAYIGTNIWNSHSGLYVSDSYKSDWKIDSSRGGTYYATSVGTHTMTVSPDDTDNYSGSVSVSWKITSRSLNSSSITINLSSTSKTFSGASQSVSVSSVTVAFGSETYTLPSSKYTVSGTTSATNVGTCTVTVTGDGSSLTSSKSATWTISALNISNCSISLSNKTYNGNSQTTSITSCTYNGYSVGTASLSGTTSATNAGTYYPTITGTGNLTGSRTDKYWTISAYSGALTVSLPSSSYDYTGSAIKPTPTVSSALGKTMTSGTDYTVSYSNNTAVGTATVSVTGKGNYSGSGSKTFSIVQRTLESISLNTTSFTYDTTTKSVTATVKSGGVTLTSGTHYSITGTTGVNEGTYTVKATGISPYKGEKTATWYIYERTSIVLTALSSSSYTYTGAAHQPTPTVKTTSSGYTVSNYTTSYSNNKNIGTATCTVKGTGTNIATSATSSKTFTISARGISAATISGVSNKTYSGAAQTQSPTLTYNGMTLVNGTDYSLSYSNNTAAGTATMTVTGKGNYNSSTSKTFTISTRAVSSITFTYTGGLTYTYTGSSQGPTIATAKYGSNSVTTTSISNNKKTAAGSYTATITGSGNLSGTTTVDWDINPRSITEATISGVSNKTYTGGSQTQSPTITYNGMTLVNGTDYSLSYSNNTAAGTARMTVTGKGNYTGSTPVDFTISTLAVGSVTFTYTGGLSYTYTGSSQGPTIATAKYGSNSVTTATISYNKKTAAGSYTATITGSGNLSGTTTVGWTISPRAISEAAVSGITNRTYSTGEHTQSLTLTYNGMTLTSGTDYTVSYANNVNVGTATITITGKGNYNSSTQKTFTISARDISTTTFASISKKTYTTNAIQPTPTLSYSSKTLVYNTDYNKITYSNNVNVGTATITVTGIGNYTGTHSTSFTIEAKALDTNMFASIGDQTYTTAAITPAPKLTYNSKTLASGTDYTSITYTDNINKGVATITVTGKGNYKGTSSTTFNIIPRPLTSSMINAITDQTYTGNAIKPTPTLKYSNDTPMEAGTDYSTSFGYANNTNVAYSGSTVVASATVTVTGIGNYTGSASMTFKILPKALSDCTITLSDTTFTYNTSTQSVTATVSIGSTDIPTANYTVSGNSAKDQGTYTVTVTAVANKNLSGSNATKSFVIYRRNLSDISVADIPAQRYIHDGNGTATAVTLDSNELILSYKNDNPMKLTTDYTFTYTNATSIYEDVTFTDNTKAKPYITITGQGNYTGQRTEYFIIYDNNLNLDPEASVTIPYSTHVYTGHEIKPIVTAKWSSTTLTLGTDYEVVYTNNTNKGTATVTITGINAYHGIVTRTFTISAANIAYLKNTEMTLSKDEYTYTGNANNPTPTVKYTHSQHYVHGDGVNCASVVCTTSNCNCSSATIVTLTNGTDYTYSITNNVNAGTSLVTFTGKGNYTGTNYTNFVINPRDISAAEINGFSSAGYEYTGSAIVPDFTVTYDNGSVAKTLEYKTDYSRSYTNNVNAGQATVTITGIGNFTGTETATFKIISVPADKVEERLNFEDFSSYVYTGSAITPDIHATYNTKPITVGTSADFTVQYTNNTNAGTASVKLTGNTGGNFEGITINKTFTITAKSITELNTPDVFGDRYKYTGSQIKPVITLNYNDMTLVSGTDFNVTYTNNIAIGQGTINITGKGNYTGTLTGNFTIYSYDITQLTPTLDTANTTYRGKDIAVKPAVTLNDPEAEFTVSYTNNYRPGTATVTITGTGENYKGTQTLNFTIDEASVASSSVTAVASDAYFTDSRYNPELTLRYTTSVLNQDGSTDTHIEELENGEDFEVTSIEVDPKTNTGIARIQGLDAFIGSREISFNVVARDITTVEVNTLSDSIYTGEAITPEVILTFGGETLVVDEDYTIEYRDNTNAGTAYVDITGIGNYGGTRTLSFEIAKRRLEVNPTFASEDVYYEYMSLPGLVDESVAEYGVFEWLVPNFVVGTNDYEWNFVPFDTDNYEVLSGKETFTALDVTIERIETEFAEGKEHKAYDTFNSENVTIKVLYSNGVYQELEAKDYKVSLADNEYMVAGEIVFVTVEEGGEEHTEIMGIVKARPLTITFDKYANLTENGENQTISVDVDGLYEGYENAYTIVYHNLTTGTTSNSITTGGTYRVEVILSDNNYVIDGDSSITFNVKSQEVRNANVTISSEEGFAGGSLVDVKTYETEEALVSAYNLDNVDFGGKYLRAYSFEVLSNNVTVSNNTETTAQTVKVALTAEDISVSEALKLYAVRNGELVALDYTTEDGKFVFNCQLTDVVVFVEEVEEEGFNWKILVWSMVGLLVVGAVVGVVLYFDIRNKKGTKKTSKRTTN